MATATYIPIATQTLGSATSTITFSSIPSGYTDLKIQLNNASPNQVNMTFNNDGSGSTYSWTTLSGNGAAASSTTANSASYLDLDPGTWSSGPQSFAINIFSYTASAYKTILSQYANDSNGSGYVNCYVGLWRNTAAITTISLINASANFPIGTTATLWGI